jgi:hypothetical protein
MSRLFKPYETSKKMADFAGDKMIGRGRRDCLDARREARHRPARVMIRSGVLRTTESERIHTLRSIS